jgi:sugar lactone lactonase YvrE
MLGGDDRRTLYVMTAPTSTESVVSVERSGSIEQARVKVGGAGLP